jgi:hypothetical protein
MFDKILECIDLNPVVAGFVINPIVQDFFKTYKVPKTL